MAVATAILNGNFHILTETEELQRLLGTGQVLLYIGKLSLNVNLYFYPVSNIMLNKCSNHMKTLGRGGGGKGKRKN